MMDIEDDFKIRKSDEGRRENKESRKLREVLQTPSIAFKLSNMINKISPTHKRFQIAFN